MQQLTSQTGQSTPIIRARYEFLKNEVARWQEENILNRAQADEILSRYSIDGGKQHGLTVLLATGACGFGAAVLLFISSNWPGVSTQIKGLVVVVSMIACYIAAWKLKGIDQLKTLAAEALVFLGCIFFGSGANLVSQHFQTTGGQMEILIWAMGIAPLVILFRSQSAAILFSALVLYRAFNTSEPFTWFVPLAALSALYAAYYMRNQWALALSLGSAALIFCGTKSGPPDEFSLMFFGISCFILHLWHEHSRRFQEFAMPYLLASFGFCLMALFVMANEYSAQQILERTSIQRIQIEAILSLALLATLVRSPAAKTRWPIAAGIGVVAAVCLSSVCMLAENRFAAACGILVVNLYYLFYFTSNVENRILQFVPVLTLTSYVLIYLSAVPGGAMIGSGIAFGLGLVLMICSFAALSRLTKTRAVSERSLK